MGRAQDGVSMEMPTTDSERVNVVVKVDDLRADGWVIRRDLLKNERMKRSLKIFGGFFLVACFTVFVPILHFILPPLLIISGSVLAIGEYGNTGEILKGEIPCPNCKKVNELQREGEEWPRTFRCQGCSFTLTIERA